jgi:hypothetical protein
MSQGAGEVVDLGCRNGLFAAIMSLDPVQVEPLIDLYAARSPSPQVPGRFPHLDFRLGNISTAK